MGEAYREMGEGIGGEEAKGDLWWGGEEKRSREKESVGVILVERGRKETA